MTVQKNSLPKGERYWAAQFDATSDGRRRAYHVVQCATCPVQLVLTTNSTAEMAANVIRKRAQFYGWVIGSTHRKDRCPACAGRQPKSNVIPIKSEESTMPEPTILQRASDEPPRTMDVDDRRVIFTKLTEIYIGKEEGYAAPWTDQTVSKDLGVPLAWVVEVRDQFFGPARDNTEVRELLEKLASYQLAITSLKEEAGATTHKLGNIAQKMGAMELSMRDLQRQGEHLATQAARIQKALS